jgi:hypothetical protein
MSFDIDYHFTVDAKKYASAKSFSYEMGHQKLYIL